MQFGDKIHAHTKVLFISQQLGMTFASQELNLVREMELMSIFAAY